MGKYDAKKTPSTLFVVLITLLFVFVIIPFSMYTMEKLKPKAVQRKHQIERLKKDIEKYKKKIVRNDDYMQKFAEVSTDPRSLSLEFREYGEKRERLYRQIAEANKRIEELKNKKYSDEP